MGPSEQEPFTGMGPPVQEPFTGMGPPEVDNVATAEDWQKAINEVVKAVVVVRTSVCRSFDTETAGLSLATGFVVDKQRGIILTARQPVIGPNVAQVTFANHEETTVQPIYGDPVHDFGFFRYNPASIKFSEYEEIPLAPEAACVGLDIRVIGNDDSEKVSILSGTIASLHRDAPDYNKDGYNDFNTFYMQAASGSKYGSSGSPVIDWQGRAVALHVDGHVSAAPAFFLPLERVVRALDFLQDTGDYYIDKWEAVTIPRGTLQATFVHKGFEDLLRLGLHRKIVRFVQPSAGAGNGMLVVDSVVRDGPAHNHLEPGDVLVGANWQVITQFLQLETLLDDNVDQTVNLEIERGGSHLSEELLVQDLHSITPAHFLEVSGAVIHPLSYQQARNFHLPCGPVYVSEPGYMLHRAGVPRHAIIDMFDGKVVSKLEDLISILSKLPRGAQVPLVYTIYTARHLQQLVLVTVDRHEWYAPAQIYTRDDSSGLWTTKAVFQPELTDDFSSIGTSSENALGKLLSEDGKGIGSKQKQVEDDMSSVGIVTDGSINETGEAKEENKTDTENAALRGYASNAERVIDPTLVRLQVSVPPSCMLDGVHSQNFSGTGVIIYHSSSMGLVAADRNTVAVSASDVMLYFAAYPVEIPGEVVFLHPAHNYALVAYKPSALGTVAASMVRAAELLPKPLLRRGDSVYVVGLNESLQVISKKSVVTNTSKTDLEIIELETDFGCKFSGVLTDEHGRVQALWGRFSSTLRFTGTSKDPKLAGGIPVNAISQVLDKIKSGASGPSLLINGTTRSMPLVRILEVELHHIALLRARTCGLSEEWIQALFKKDPVSRQILFVRRSLEGSKAQNLLVGDLVLAVNKEPVTCFREIENVCQEMDNGDNDGNLSMTVFRGGSESNLPVGTDLRDGNGTTRVINWCGCVVQHSYPAVRSIGFHPRGAGVYVTQACPGSPAERYGLFPSRWIVKVDGRHIRHLDDFVIAIKRLEHGKFVRVDTVDRDGKNRILSVKQDLHYWPTWEVRFDPETAIWRRTVIKALDDPQNP
ncbi:DegP protease 7, degradation of periplasmic proteins 7 [Hibiscus trionum]|uniref:DegP protease 7, degradation of periplasmic proteins 7 n=1 Tax=Hibiscus trionum TaxID=183268 RepID=A0A9W7MSR0_HIBTR|nr:DegP protease 7, degradation of periplasmic proteins 7 [Hibiscus trionum]